MAHKAFGNISPAKARKILREGMIGGKKLTAAQRRGLGARAGGKK